MKHTLLFLSCLVIASLLFAQEPKLAWAKQIGGAGSDEGSAIALDAAGNVYTTGYFQGTVDFDPGPGTFYLTAGTYNSEIFVSKLDAQGNFLWAKQMSGTNNNQVNSIALDAAGNVYTTGYFQGTVDFDPGPGTFYLTAGTDIFVSKLDAQGNFLWAIQMGGSGTDLGLAITTDAAGKLYTTGQFMLTVDFDPGPGTFNLTSAGIYDIFVSKLDAAGNFLWVKQKGGSRVEAGTGIAVDAAGNVYTTGYFWNTADFDPGPGTFNLTPTGNDMGDAFVSKLDAQGNFLWAKQMGTEGTAIALDAAGNVYTTGTFGGTTDFDPGPNTFNLTAAHVDIFISKLDAKGNFVWAIQMAGSSSQSGSQGHSITLDMAGNVYTTGNFYGTVDFDPGPGTFYLTATGNGVNIFISKLDAQGNFVWAGAIGGDGYGDGNDIALDAASNIYITGSFNGTVDFDPGPSTFNLTTTGGFDAFVLKLSQQACTPPTFNLQVVVDATCGKSNGSLLLTPTSGTAPFQYSLDGGTTYVPGPDQGYTFSNLAPGTYQLRLKDASGCESAIVQQTLGSDCPTPCTPPTFLNDGTIVKAPDCGQSNGSLYVIPTSGTAPFLYSKDGGETYVPSPSDLYIFEGLGAGTYQLRIKDATGCESAVVQKLAASPNCPITDLPPASTTCTTAPTFLNNDAIVKAATCGKSDGALYLIPTSGTAPFLYSINGGQSYFLGPDAGMGFQEISAGTYQLRIRDARGCESAVITREVPSGCATTSTISKGVAASRENHRAAVLAYPNPTAGKFKLQLRGFASENLQVQVLNNKGQMVEQRRVNMSEGETLDFDFTRKAKGLYLIKVISEKGVQVSKVMVQ